MGGLAKCRSASHELHRREEGVGGWGGGGGGGADLSGTALREQRSARLHLYQSTGDEQHPLGKASCHMWLMLVHAAKVMFASL
jgi:hypothetical protein